MKILWQHCIFDGLVITSRLAVYLSLVVQYNSTDTDLVRSISWKRTRNIGDPVYEHEVTRFSMVEHKSLLHRIEIYIAQ